MDAYGIVKPLRELLELSEDVREYRGVQLHLRAAFVALSNVIVNEHFPRVARRNDYLRLVYGDFQAFAKHGEITLSQTEFEHVVCKKKLDAVKEYKNRTGKSLMDSKRDIESWAESAGFNFNYSP